jgi:hypothetical protein
LKTNSRSGEASSGLLRLRPVTFCYKKPYEDGSKPLDYGLIAEEVAEVYPDLVVTGADGQVETVQYQSHGRKPRITPYKSPSVYRKQPTGDEPVP